MPTAESAAAVGSGTLDMAYTWGGYHKGLIPIGEIEAGLPMAWANIDQAHRFHFAYGFDDLAAEVYAEHNIKFLSTSFESPSYAISKVPIRTVDEMKPLKFRATAAMGEIMAKFGIASVYFGSEEFYTNLATGVVDAIIYGSDGSYYKLKLHEVATHITDMGWLDPYTSSVHINMDIWNALPDDLKGILKAVTTEYFTMEMRTYQVKQLWEARDAEVFEYYTFATEEQAKLVSAAADLWDKVAAVSPRNAEAIEMLKAMNREFGRL